MEVLGNNESFVTIYDEEDPESMERFNAIIDDVTAEILSWDNATIQFKAHQYAREFIDEETEQSNN